MTALTGESLAAPAREGKKQQLTATQGTSANKQFIPTITKLQGWIGTWYNPENQPQRLQGSDQDTLSRQGRCWSCRGSRHRGNNDCCPMHSKKLNTARITEIELDAENA